MTDELLSRARAAGVLTTYVDVHGHTVHADAEALERLLDVLGDRPAPAPAPWPHGVPERAFHPDPGQRDWGIFLPHHALHSERTRGHGDLTSLLRLGRWAGAHGARVLGTLPLLPTFLHEGPGPYEPSPYAPVSRYFWGEHLVDPTATAEWRDCPDAHAILAEAEHDGSLAALRSGEHIDPAAAWRLQWRLLSALSRVFWADAERSEGVADFVRHGGPRGDRLWTYAWFRAATQVRGPWPTWPGVQQRFDGPHDLSLDADVLPDVDPQLARTWAYAQVCAHRQIEQLRAGLAEAGVDLYLDLPIGTHPDGFDTWFGTGRAPLHASGASAGAPPDPFFTNGQDWGFPPVHPSVSAEDQHRDLRIALSHHADAAPRLRIDHILGFYRLFWIPRGLGAKRGIYVRYPAQDWWRTLVEVSHQTGCQMIGENLGMVPPALTEALQRHGVAGMHVGQFSLHASADHPLRLPLPGDLSCLNTHDMPTFGGWWSGRDLELQRELGWLSEDQLHHARNERAHLVGSLRPLADRGPLASRSDVPEATRVAASLYAELARSEAGLVLVSLEDLWDEREPQNVPGTWRELPNWLRRADKSLDEITQDSAFQAFFSEMSRLRPTGQRP